MTSSITYRGRWFTDNDQKVVGLQAQAVGLQSQINSRNDQIATLQASDAAKANQITTLQNSNTSLASQITSLNSQIATLQAGTWLSGSSTATQTANYTITNTDRLVPVDSTSAAFTITLRSPTAVPKVLLVIKRRNGGPNAVTVSAASGNTIDGRASVILDTYGDCWLIPDSSLSTNWMSIKE